MHVTGKPICGKGQEAKLGIHSQKVCAWSEQLTFAHSPTKKPGKLCQGSKLALQSRKQGPAKGKVQQKVEMLLLAALY